MDALRGEGDLHPGAAAVDQRGIAFHPPEMACATAMDGVPCRPYASRRDQIWWTTQPMEDPERRDHLFEVIDWVGWDRLLFATDYPHWDYDEPSRVLPAGVSDANREAFYLGNARTLYGLEQE